MKKKVKTMIQWNTKISILIFLSLLSLETIGQQAAKYKLDEVIKIAQIKLLEL